jgi:hypothetical protein
MSTQSTWSMVNQLQLFLLLPFVPDYMPSKVSEFIFGMKKFMLSFNFIPINKISKLNFLIYIHEPIIVIKICLISFLEIVKVAIEYISEKQPDEELENLDLEYGSTIVNALKILIIFGILVTFHLIIL